MEIINIEHLEVEKLVKFTQSIIEFDNQPLIDEVNKVIAKFKGLVITEEMLPEIKKDRAMLNNMAKRFDEIRIKIGKDYKAPLVGFEKKITEINTILKNQVMLFDDQTDGFEFKRKIIKRDMVENMIQDVCIRKGLDEVKYSSQLTFIDKYYNVGETDMKIIKDLEARADTILIQQKNDELQEQLHNSKIKFREIMLSNFSRDFGVAALYSDYTVEKYPNDSEVMELLKSQLVEVEKTEAVLIEKRPIKMATQETTHDKPKINYVDLRVYIDESKIKSILRDNFIEYKIITVGQKAITNEAYEMPF